MARQWNKDKNVKRAHDLLNTGRLLYPLSYGELIEKQGHLLGSYMTPVLQTARIRDVDSALYAHSG